MGDEYWVVTQAELQGEDPLFSKPKLAENLLKKPPFRFLHDCITGVQKSTGFAPGLFSDAELDAKAVAADKEAKNIYLTKIIKVVSIVVGEPVPAKPQKIMAGMEAENTNIFLQQLALAARSCRNGDQGASAVQQVLQEGGDASADAPPPPPPPSVPAHEVASAPPAPVPAPEPAPEMKELAPAPAPSEPAAPAADSEQKLERRGSSRSRDRGERGESRGSSRGKDKERREEKEERKERKEKEKKERKERDREVEREVGAPPEFGADPSPAAGGQRPGSMSRVERPQSARKGPPKAGSRPQDVMQKREQLVPAEGPKLFVEGDDLDDDEVEVVTEAEPVFRPIGGEVALGGEGQGALVKDILDAQKQLAQDAAPDKEVEQPASTGIVLKRRGSSKAAAQPAAARASDLNALRGSIQSLCQSTMPLGKSMDYLQEDLENMKKELKFWMNEHRVYQDKLIEQQRFTEDLLNPQAALADVDNQIQQAKDRIKGMKAQILRSDDTIGKLLAMVVSGTR